MQLINIKHIEVTCPTNIKTMAEFRAHLQYVQLRQNLQTVKQRKICFTINKPNVLNKIIKLCLTDPNETCKFLHDIYTGTFFIEGFIPNYAHALTKDIHAIFYNYFQSALFKEIALSKTYLNAIARWQPDFLSMFLNTSMPTEYQQNIIDFFKKDFFIEILKMQPQYLRKPCIAVQAELQTHIRNITDTLWVSANRQVLYGNYLYEFIISAFHTKYNITNQMRIDALKFLFEETDMGMFLFWETNHHASGLISLLTDAELDSLVDIVLASKKLTAYGKLLMLKYLDYTKKKVMFTTVRASTFVLGNSEILPFYQFVSLKERVSMLFTDEYLQQCLRETKDTETFVNESIDMEE